MNLHAGRDRQPVHTVYGGAHLFRANTMERLGVHARGSLQTFAGSPGMFANAFGMDGELAGNVYARVVEKLEREPVEDYRIDFEDGYGRRADEEEDRHAVHAAREAALAFHARSLPPFFGIRIKALSGAAGPRARRTLELFLTTLVNLTDHLVPPAFAVTLPKVTSPSEVEELAGMLAAFEALHELAPGTIQMELMVETPRAIFDAAGKLALPGLVRAAGGRCRGAHFGPYDYTATLGIAGEHQNSHHPACDFARSAMQVALAGSGVALADGPTNVLPIPPHRGEALRSTEIAENEQAVHNAWRIHFDQVQRAMRNGFYQGWDLHPAQLPARYAAVFAFFLQSLPSAKARLHNFQRQAEQATRLGSMFDDAATGEGLLNLFRRGLNCGAFTEDEAGITPAKPLPS